MKLKIKLFQILFAAIMVWAVAIIIASAVANADSDRIIEEADVFIEEHVNHMAEKSTTMDESYWKEQLIAKVTGFEVGYCCEICKHYVASACINRMNSWYNGDPIDMITDGNEEYYYMNPMYVTATDVNGWNYYEHTEEMMAVVQEAEQRTADIWYWDCDDSQRAWAEVAYHCPEDGMWFYR